MKKKVWNVTFNDVDLGDYEAKNYRAMKKKVNDMLSIQEIEQW